MSSHELTEVSIVSQLTALLGLRLLLRSRLLLISRFVLRFRLLGRSLLCLLRLLLSEHIGEAKLAHSIAVRNVTLGATQFTLGFEEVILDRLLLLL